MTMFFFPKKIEIEISKILLKIISTIFLIFKISIYGTLLYGVIIKLYYSFEYNKW